LPAFADFSKGIEFSRDKTLDPVYNLKSRGVDMNVGEGAMIDR
jgi:hypothetical protein